MRILVLGGTWFLGRALVTGALARGWEVTTFTRGQSGTPPEGAQRITGDRHDPFDVHRLAQAGPWDATIDTSAYEPSDVLSIVRILGERAGRYTLLSTVSAYKDWPTRQVTETSPLWPSRVDVRASDPDVAALPEPFQYGTLKAGAELAAQTAPGGALILRPGVILGPAEYTGRMLTLFERAQRGGRWLLPAAPDRRIQPVDVRDVAAFTIDQVEAGAEGPYNVVAPPLDHATYGDLIAACLEATGGTSEPVWAAQLWLKDQNVRQWTEIPLWRVVPGTWEVHDEKAAAAGLVCRPLAETVTDTWTDYQVQPPVPHERQAEHGMDPDKEARILAAWDELVAGTRRQ